MQEPEISNYVNFLVMKLRHEQEQGNANKPGQSTETPEQELKHTVSSIQAPSPNETGEHTQPTEEDTSDVYFDHDYEDEELLFDVIQQHQNLGGHLGLIKRLIRDANQ